TGTRLAPWALLSVARTPWSAAMARRMASSLSRCTASSSRHMHSTPSAPGRSSVSHRGVSICRPVNVVFLSPHFPPGMYLYVQRLREAGATVLGIADVAYEAL